MTVCLGFIVGFLFVCAYTSFHCQNVEKHKVKMALWQIKLVCMKGWGCRQVVEHVLCMHEVWFNPSTTK